MVITAGLKSAYPELVKDYEVNSKRLVNEGVIPQAVPLNLAALDPKVVEGFHLFICLVSLTVANNF